MRTLKVIIEDVSTEPGFADHAQDLRTLYDKLREFFVVDFRDDELNDEAIEIDKLLG